MCSSCVECTVNGDVACVECGGDEFTCNKHYESVFCIAASHRCNFYTDCIDVSDERDCLSQSHSVIHRITFILHLTLQLDFTYTAFHPENYLHVCVGPFMAALCNRAGIIFLPCGFFFFFFFFFFLFFLA